MSKDFDEMRRKRYYTRWYYFDDTLCNAMTDLFKEDKTTVVVSIVKMWIGYKVFYYQVW